MADSRIEWTEKVWNPVRGCSIVSAGCTNCYAMKQAHRFSGKGQPYEGLTQMSRGGPVWTGRVEVIPEMLDAPLGWKKPARVFVNSMSDLFHEDVPERFIDAVFGVMLMTPQHTYQILTKRPDRMREYMIRGDLLRPLTAAAKIAPKRPANDMEWPPRNVWLGVSVEDQRAAEERIPRLLGTPAAVRWISAEPLLGPLDFNALSEGPWNLNALSGLRENPFGDLMEREKGPRLDWVVVGGESGPGARPFVMEWARSILKQCRKARVPAFVKQMGANLELSTADMKLMTGANTIAHRWRLRDPKGGDMSEWPEDLRVREYPR